MNFIDFMAILPVFLTMILEGLEDMRVGQSICALQCLYFQTLYCVDNRQGWEGDPPGARDEDHEGVQAGQALRRPPVPGLHSAAGRNNDSYNFHIDTVNNAHYFI